MPCVEIFSTSARELMVTAEQKAASKKRLIKKKRNTFTLHARTYKLKKGQIYC